MKRTLIILLLLVAQTTVFSQGVVKLTDGEPAYIPNYLIIEGNLYFKTSVGYTSLEDTLHYYVSKSDSSILYFTPHQIDSVLAVAHAFDGTPAITRTSWPWGESIGGSTVVEVLNNLLFPSVPPTSTIASSLATTQEYMETGTDLSINLTWSATRPTACLDITKITVDGVSQTLDSPFDVGHTQNGILTGRALPRNTQTTYTITVNSSDKSDNSSVTINWRWKRYWGKSADQTITDADILALTGAGVGTGNEFATNRQKNYDGIDGGGNYLVFAFPASFGTPTFKINGLTSTAFTKVRENTFINASGGSTTYQVWVSNSQMNSPISEFEIQ